MVRGRLKRLSNHSHGYLAVSLHSGNKDRMFLVHRLVVAAFIGPIPPKMEVNHKNGNKKDNRVENLEIVTRQCNIDHAVATGLINNKGSRNMRAVLSEQQVQEIRNAYTEGGKWKGGKGYKALAKIYGVSWTSIRQVIKGRTWRHLATGVGGPSHADS